MADVATLLSPPKPPVPVPAIVLIVKVVLGVKLGYIVDTVDGVELAGKENDEILFHLSRNKYLGEFVDTVILRIRLLPVSPIYTLPIQKESKRETPNEVICIWNLTYLVSLHLESTK